VTSDQYEAKINELEDRLLRAREAAHGFASDAKDLIKGYADANFPGDGKSAKRIRKHMHQAAEDLFGG
jgi:hypothetical protein